MPGVKAFWKASEFKPLTVIRIEDTKSGEPLEFLVTHPFGAILERGFAEREQFAGEARG